MAKADDAFDALMRSLSGWPPKAIMEALAASVDPKDLEQLAAELDQFLLYAADAIPASDPVDTAMEMIKAMDRDTRQRFDKVYQKAKDNNFGEIPF